MEVAQRQALLRAMLEELGERGYEKMSVGRALLRAGISEAEFEAEFDSKDECLLAGYECISGQLVERAMAGWEGKIDWPERVRSALTAVLEAAAARPDLARVMTRSFPGIRPSTYKLYVELLGRFLPYLREGREYSGIGDQLPAEVELLAVGSAEAIIFSEVDAGRTARLPQLMPEILFSILVPFIGPDRAADEMRIAAAST